MTKIIENGKLISLFDGPFEFVESGFCDGLYNMQFDEKRAKECSNGTQMQMFRLYGWSPWAVSLGANQKEEDIDKEECFKRGFSIVRRPTGGRAVLHADELTYSIVVKKRENYNVHNIYRDIHIFLLESLRNLGCNDIDFEKSQADFKTLYKESSFSVSCFASSARYEISWNNKKIVGSAQRLFGDVLLQHGSILLDKGHEQLAYITKTKTKESQRNLLNYIENHSATLSQATGRKISFVECAEAIKKNI